MQSLLLVIKFTNLLIFFSKRQLDFQALKEGFDLASEIL